MTKVCNRRYVGIVVVADQSIQITEQTQTQGVEMLGIDYNKVQIHHIKRGILMVVLATQEH